MSQPQDPQRPFLPFGNPFQMILPKSSNLSPRLLSILNSFEATMSERLESLKPKDMEDILSLSWMISAAKSLSAIHTDVKALITSLELPVSDWDEKWIDIYLDNSVKLLDVCIAFSSEISRLNHGHLFLQCSLHNLDCATPVQFTKARSSLDGWKQHVSSKNPRLEKCSSTLDNLIDTLDLPKIKNSSKGKVLMRAMYGVRLVTGFICGVLAAAFSRSADKLSDFKPPETCLWADTFTNLQAVVHGQIRNVHSSGKVASLKECDLVHTSVMKLYPLSLNEDDPEAMRISITDLRQRADMLSQGLDLLAKEVDGFFQIILTGRDALLGNLRVGSDMFNSTQKSNHAEGPTVR
ncbi:hypothetical protein LIER_09507 [Lithospermum erythrorhizon]|uniref:Protein BPS1, chloroplastic-like n=1 Tax=Lithospermum erythrorhizon TaxID=34254 RepID=A0AAV3PH61_LITER